MLSGPFPLSLFPLFLPPLSRFRPCSLSHHFSPLHLPPFIPRREGPKGSPQKGYPWLGRFLDISLRNYCIKCPKIGESWPFHGYPFCGYPFWSSSTFIPPCVTPGKLRCRHPLWFMYSLVSCWRILLQNEFRKNIFYVTEARKLFWCNWHVQCLGRLIPKTKYVYVISSGWSVTSKIDFTSGKKNNFQGVFLH